ncbi:hypothetical protein EGW08_022262 [Elysia chlorotica]|uniref:Uncharacterized protein n=1 Tax=Elysia chlorotica TaxID=188477 RepID=A0A3S0ZL77_ELYCH|nr:hypothetical protein EGW08_022262 [Elysia chlorotica]
MLRTLARQGWVDRFTRCVFLEFTVYNPSTNMFTQVQLAFEMDRYGGLWPSKRIHTAILSPKHTEPGSWLPITMSETLASICVLFYMCVAINEILYTSYRMFFSNPWNWLEVLVSVVSLLCAIFYLCRVHAYQEVMSEFEELGHEYFLDFSRIFYWQRAFHVSMAVLGGLVILKMLKVTAFNPFTKFFAQTLKFAYHEYTGLLFSSTLVLFAFALLGTLLFGGSSSNYHTLGRASLTLLFFVMGESNQAVLFAAHAVTGKAFFLVFVLAVKLVLVNMFIAVFVEALELSRYVQYRGEEATVRCMLETLRLYFTPAFRIRDK